jgi:hypothetical protein
MAAKPPDLTKPSFYLDQSTLCDVFEAMDVTRPTPYRRLVPWVTNVAHEANLCLSFYHVAELARWETTEKRQAMAGWLEDLPIVWAAPYPKLRPLEYDHWLRIALGIRSDPLTPFVPSKLSLFNDVGPGESARMLKNAMIGAMVRDKHPWGGAGDFVLGRLR